jgi:hypothetical protein
MIRWADCGGTKSLVDLVHEAFHVLATGLADPAGLPYRKEAR